MEGKHSWRYRLYASFNSVRQEDALLCGATDFPLLDVTPFCKRIKVVVFSEKLLFLNFNLCSLSIILKEDKIPILAQHPNVINRICSAGENPGTRTVRFSFPLGVIDLF
ncbi:hypothetical protein CBF45_12425 [Bordetella sp. J329]|nr:hypothetical protein CBF45_12425 [Bordetella sp. J329]